MEIQGGAIVSLLDVRSGEQFCGSGDAWARLAELPSGCATNEDWHPLRSRWLSQRPDLCRRLQEARLQAGPQSTVSIEEINGNATTIVYRHLQRGDPADEIRYAVRADPGSGDLWLQASLHSGNAGLRPVSIDTPILNLTGESLILGCGTRYTRGDARGADSCTRSGNNLYSPLMAIVEGRKGCVFAYADSPWTFLSNLRLLHEESHDDLILQAGAETTRVVLPFQTLPWRIGVCRRWEEAARRYRASFEAMTGAQPLWRNALPWVREIHATHRDIPTAPHGVAPPEVVDAYFRDLAQIVPPEKLLLVCFQLDSVLFGDVQTVSKRDWYPAVEEAISTYGFRCLVYHPYNLVYSPKGMQARLELLKRYGWLPDGYGFTPQVGGSTDGFYRHLRPAAIGYGSQRKPLDEVEHLWMLHPGSEITRSYLVRYLGEYCRLHQTDGCYLDTSGTCGHYWWFPEERQVMDGRDGMHGEAELLLALREAHPALALMTETEHEWTIPWAPFTWEGQSHFLLPRQHPTIDARVNHPLRTALWGSYAWTRGPELEPDEEALIGALPTLVLGDDWSVAQCRLFADEELFPDMPEVWEPDARACYRATGGRWFQFRRLPYGDGYVELGAADPDAGTPCRARLVRLKGTTRSPFAAPSRIQGWIGYRDQQPIGLNPAHAYPVLFDPPRDEVGAWIADLPEGTYIRAIRPAEKHCVVEWGTLAGQAVTGEVAVCFHRRCARIAEPQGDRAGPFEPGSTITLTAAMPGGLVLAWEEPVPVDGRLRANLLQASGFLLANGIPDRQRARGGSIYSRPTAIGGTAYRSVNVARGRHRGYAEAWVTLATNAAPALKFEVGYDRPADPAARVPPPVRLSVQANGAELWSETVEPAAGWRPREVPLPAFAGRNVLLTLAAGSVAAQNLNALLPPAVFGRVRVDHNPVSLDELPDGSALSPARVLLADDFAGPDLAPEWTAHVSPAQESNSLTVGQGRLCFEARHYKYCYLARLLPSDVRTAQVRIQVPATGGDPRWNPGLCLYWERGRYCFITGAGRREADQLIVAVGGETRPRVLPLEGRMRVTDDNLFDFWVRIQLAPEEIRFGCSLDGRTWQDHASIPRSPDYLGGPAWLFLGKGVEGAGEGFQNDAPHEGRPVAANLQDLILGR